MSYEFLKAIVSPRHMVVARSFMGLKEIAGNTSNQTILSWAKQLGLDSIYKNDDTSWCALFVAFVMMQAGRKIIIPTKDSWDYLRALKYQEANLKTVAMKDAAFGDIMIFKRPEGGHVAFYVGEDTACYHILGGNQGNKVSVIRIDKKRLVAVRRPDYISFNPEKMIVSAEGAISTNEA